MAAGSGGGVKIIRLGERETKISNMQLERQWVAAREVAGSGGGFKIIHLGGSEKN